MARFFLKWLVSYNNIDIKSSFLNDFLKKKVHVTKLKGFEYPKHSDHVFKFGKYLYGLKQAPQHGMRRCPNFFWIKAIKRVL